MVDLALPVNKLTKADIILISSIVLFSIVVSIFISFHNSAEASGFEIRIDGELHSKYSFSDLDNGEIIEIKTEYGYNKFLYENKSIKCIDTDCADKIELHSASISKPNQMIVCLPNKLTVQITGQNSIDTVSY